VDEFLTLIIFFIVIGLVERVLKAAQKAKAEAPAQREAQDDEEGGLEKLPAGLQDLVAEELGINLERKPRVEGPPEPAPPAPPGRERVVYQPGGRREEARTGRRHSADRGAAITQARREAAAQRRHGPALTRQPLRQPEQQPLSLEERAMLERGEPVSLERPRRPEDHERFHDRYGIEEPVASHAEFHDRYMEKGAREVPRGRRGRLPERRYWNPVQKAVIWAEVLGPPKGLEG
jgi:hypothetical protein